MDVVDAPGAQAAARKLAAAPELAVDLEADAMHAFRARLCFLQVATDQERVPLRHAPARGGAPRCSRPLMGDPARTKFFHAAPGDLQYLAEAGVRVQGLFDTHRAATLLGWPKVGLADLARERLGVELPKEHQQSDFSLRPLPPGMRDYIANDVRYLVELGRQVTRGVPQGGHPRGGAAGLRSACATRRRRGRTWARTSSRSCRARGCTPAQVALANAIAQALHRKRLEWAEADNVPMGRMLSNMAITDIAVKPPSNPRELARAAGVRGAFVRAHGEEVLALVRELLEKSRAGRAEAGAGAEGAEGPEPAQARGGAQGVARGEGAGAQGDALGGAAQPRASTRSLSRPPANLEELRAVPYFGEKRVRLYGRGAAGAARPASRAGLSPSAPPSRPSPSGRGAPLSVKRGGQAPRMRVPVPASPTPMSPRA